MISSTRRGSRGRSGGSHAVVFHNAAGKLRVRSREIRQLELYVTTRPAADALFVADEAPGSGQSCLQREDEGVRGDGVPRARPDLYSLASSTFVGRIYALFGLKNVADAAKGRRLPAAL